MRHRVKKPRPRVATSIAERSIAGYPREPTGSATPRRTCAPFPQTRDAENARFPKRCCWNPRPSPRGPAAGRAGRGRGEAGRLRGPRRGQGGLRAGAVTLPCGLRHLDLRARGLGGPGRGRATSLQPGTCLWWSCRCAPRQRDPAAHSMRSGRLNWNVIGE